MIDLDEVMDELKLGYIVVKYIYIISPNAALVYCMDFLHKNINFLEDKLLKYQDAYVIFDFPGT